MSHHQFQAILEEKPSRLRSFDVIYPHEWPLFNKYYDQLACHALVGEQANPIHLLDWTPVGLERIKWDGGGQHDNHSQWVSTLHRFENVSAMAVAFQHNGDQRYARSAQRYMVDWLNAHPVQSDQSWQMATYDCTLNLAIRIGNSRWVGWLGACEIFGKGGMWSAELINAVVESLAAQLDYLMDHLTIVGNWRIAQADALVTAGLALPSHPRASVWLRTGVALLNDAALHQILPDGTHIERVPMYHHWMTHVFACYWRLQQRMPGLGLNLNAKQIASMFDYACASLRPTGDFNAMHDCVGGETDILQRNIHMHWGNMWQLRDSFYRDAQLPLTEMPSKLFVNAGQALLRDSIHPDATYITFDATRWGGPHCHRSRNAIQLGAFGRTLLVDPGYLTYAYGTSMRDYATGTFAHNTVTVDGMNQSSANPTQTCCAQTEELAVVASEYTGGYWPVKFQKNQNPKPLAGRHHRSMIWLKGKAVLVVDALYIEQTSEEHVAMCNWQFSTGNVDVDYEHFRAQTMHEDANLLLIDVQARAGTQMRLATGGVDPIAGWTSTDQDVTAAPLLSFQSPLSHGYAEFVTLLIPFRGKVAPAVTYQFTRPNPLYSACLKLIWQDGHNDNLYWTYRQQSPLGQIGSVYTDAPLLWQTHMDGYQQTTILGGRFASDANAEKPLEKKRFFHLPESEFQFVS